ncbi:MAG: S8 family serine peptidase [Ignavibacteriae bacterium]|nr:S8 family serine peptidase [Ignavibacteriota bacterium]MCB9242355.1 S8 family serine peptidase [Ignavibacteriales bacterium]
MRRYIQRITVLFAILLFFSANIQADETPDAKYWIIFKDKGQYKPGEKITPGSDAYETGKSLLSDRAIKRRLKVLDENNLIDYMDLPLDQRYVSGIQSMGVEIIAKSRWLNGVSAYLTESQVNKIKKLNYVDHLQIVNKMIKQDVSMTEETYYDGLRSVEYIEPTDTNLYKYDYGPSLKQNESVNVPKLHNMGVTGRGVLIASFDDGFEWKTHEALKNLLIIDEYDFINKDKNTAREKVQKYKDSFDQGGHGTATLSSMMGYAPGKLIGPAFDSQILLAKTEYVSSEVPMEEDFWLEAAEWAEAYGVDVITSSLIYKDYDPPYDKNTYKYENYDGNTAITTIAGDRAAYLGIVVVNAMGNYYQTAIPSLGSAADGDSIISVGAVTTDGQIASFTSNGPTSDGRTKPDVVAPGVRVYVAAMSDKKEDGYRFSDGTSFSTPITAGVAALILSVHPELTPMQVRDALRNTASNPNNPNNITGWGVINAYDAALYYGMIWSNEPQYSHADKTMSTYLASKDVIDPNSVKFYYKQDGSDEFTEVSMELIEPMNDGNNSGLYSATVDNLPMTGKFDYYFYAKTLNGDDSYYPYWAKDMYSAGQ